MLEWSSGRVVACRSPNTPSLQASVWRPAQFYGTPANHNGIKRAEAWGKRHQRPAGRANTASSIGSLRLTSLHSTTQFSVPASRHVNGTTKPPISR